MSIGSTNGRSAMFYKRLFKEVVMLTVGDIISNGFKKGFQNFLPLIVNFFLWIVTIWIPYFNVGTTIAIVAIAAKISKDQHVSYTEVFNPIYRKEMGDFFLVNAFIGLGVGIAFIFFFIPGIVLGISWSLAVLLVVDKGQDPIAAIKQSNEATYGKKWTMFFGQFLLSLIMLVVIGIVIGVLYAIGSKSDVMMIITGIVGAIMFALFASISIGAQAYIYGTLTK
jgi:hypothetical protein